MSSIIFSKAPVQEPIADSSGKITPIWQKWFTQLFAVTGGTTDNLYALLSALIGEAQTKINYELENRRPFVPDNGLVYSDIPRKPTFPGGSDGQVQYNNAGSFDGTTFTYDNGTGDLSTFSLINAAEFDAISSNPATTQGIIRLWAEDTTPVFAAYGFKAPNISSVVAAGVDNVWSLPVAEGLPGNPIVTDGAYNLSFLSVDLSQVALMNQSNIFTQDQEIFADNGSNNGINSNLYVDATSSSTPTTGFGSGIGFRAKSTTTVGRMMARIDASWATATDASRKAQITFRVYDTTFRNVMTMQATGSGATVSLLYPTTVTPFAATGVPLVAKGATSQSANLQEWQNSGGTAIAAVKNNGAFVPASLADASAANGTMYFSTTANKLVYKDSAGTVNNLY